MSRVAETTGWTSCSGKAGTRASGAARPLGGGTAARQDAEQVRLTPVRAAVTESSYLARAASGEVEYLAVRTSDGRIVAKGGIDYAERIRARGVDAMLGVEADNPGALRLDKRLGYTVRGSGGHDNGGTDQAIPQQIASRSRPATPSARLSNGVFIQRSRFTMKSPDDADLETGIVGSGLSGIDLYLYCSGTQCLLNAMGSLMTTLERPGTKSSCLAALSSRHDQALDLGHLRTGETLCLQTRSPFPTPSGTEPVAAHSTFRQPRLVRRRSLVRNQVPSTWLILLVPGRAPAFGESVPFGT